MVLEGRRPGHCSDGRRRSRTCTSISYPSSHSITPEAEKTVVFPGSCAKDCRVDYPGEPSRAPFRTWGCWCRRLPESEQGAYPGDHAHTNYCGRLG